MKPVRGQGPLAGVRVVEMAGIGPAPFVAMVLSDLGADVIRIDRPGQSVTNPADITLRGRSARLALNLKDAGDVERLRAVVKAADVLLEGFRPGVMERMGLGPDVLLSDNPRLIYTRITGWGQTGPLARTAGHDINYIAITGALHAIGGADTPAVPLNLIGDYGGGAMLALAGLLAALVERGVSGKGQVVDAAMSDGASLLMAFTYGLKAQGSWRDQRASNLLDGGAPFYGVYECLGRGHIAIGPIEPQFHAQFLKVLEIDPDHWPQLDRGLWPEHRRQLEAIFLTKTREDWVNAFDGLDACVTPILNMEEAPGHPHNCARSTYVTTADGVVQPAPAPRFDRTPGEIVLREQPAENVLAAWGVDTGAD